MGTIGMKYIISDEWVAWLGGSNAFQCCYCCFPRQSFICQCPGREVPSGICNLDGMQLRGSISCPNVVNADAATTLYDSALMTARTLNLAVPYLVSLPWKWFAASPHPSWINSYILINMCRSLYMRCCTVLPIVFIT